MKKLTIAMVQYKSRDNDIRNNTELGLKFVREAKRAGADLVLFPECWLTSYTCPDGARRLQQMQGIYVNKDIVRWQEEALTIDSRPIVRFQEVAKELSIGIVITGFTRGKVSPQNTAFLIDRDGKILLTYNKVHTCDFNWERNLECGDGFYVCQFDEVCIGVMIGYDREYPESARELMLQGAEIILVPNDCDTMRPRLQELSVRAIENMVGIAMTNPPGARAGRSCAFSPNIWYKEDNTILIADEKIEGILYATFDIEELRNYRAIEDIGKYRKPDAYKHLKNNSGV